MIILQVLFWFIVSVAALVLASMISWRLVPAVFISESKIENPVLKGRHNDWWVVFRWVPRRLNALIGKPWKAPHKLLGTNNRADGHQDVPAPGTWSICWPPHFAILTKAGMLWGLGVRPDYDPNGKYYTLRACRHKN